MFPSKGSLWPFEPLGLLNTGLTASDALQRQKWAPGEWNLEDVSPGRGDDAVARASKDLTARAEKFEALKPRLSALGKGKVEGALKMYEALVEGQSRIGARAFMEYSANTSDQGAKARLDCAEDLTAGIENRALFFKMWWTGLSDREASKLLPSNPDFRHFLGLWRKAKPHLLDEKVEQAINLKNVTGFSAWSHHYDRTVAGFSLVVKVGGKPLTDSAGRPRRMTVEEAAKLFASPDPPTREGAYKAVMEKYAENGQAIGDVYRTIVRDWKNEQVTLRKYSRPISSRNLENDVSDEVVQTLLTACRSESKVFQAFFIAKAKMLGMKKMSRYHLYAPLSMKEKRVEYEDAVGRAMKAYDGFDHEFGRLARRTFEAGHVDSSPRPRKRNGAYCYSFAPGAVPYIFLNFTGVNRDVQTIAHESGHAIHSQLASSHSMLTFHPPLVLAETASVFGEMILFDSQMREEGDNEVKKAILLDKISAMWATILRQAYFVVFEETAHPAVAEGADVSKICDIYSSVLKEQFGDAVEVSDEFKWEWTYLPHIFHTPFYCYAYSFGNLLSLALYDMYRDEGRSFVPKYKKLLAHGGSTSPEEVLREVGVDLGSAKFWKGGFNVVGRMVDDLLSL